MGQRRHDGPGLGSERLEFQWVNRTSGNCLRRGRMGDGGFEDDWGIFERLLRRRGEAPPRGTLP